MATTHTPFTDPGPHAGLLSAVPPDTPSLHTAVTNAILHYRAESPTPEQVADIDNRWVSSILDVVVDRFDGPLSQARPDDRKVGGCCRDHSLLAVAILRQHGIAARTRVGFANYFSPGFCHDHVVAERWRDDRWVRFDPEFDAAGIDGAAHDLPTGPDAPFQTAAQAWLSYRAGSDDLLRHGVAPGVVHLSGPGFVQSYVLLEIAHRMGAEVLLWDGWGGMAEGRIVPGQPMPVVSSMLNLTDRIARLTQRADDGEAAAEAELASIWADDERVHVGEHVETFSPSGRTGRTDLQERTTQWRDTSA